jgi:hypothetical protein
MTETRSLTLAEFLLARIAEDEDRIPIVVKGGMLKFNRRLAECEAKRRIIELHHAIEVRDWNPQGYCAECTDSGWVEAVDGAYPVGMPCRTLRLLALPYADHPDYREEWRP